MSKPMFPVKLQYFFSKTLTKFITTDKIHYLLSKIQKMANCFFHFQKIESIIKKCELDRFSNPETFDKKIYALFYQP